MLFAPVFPLSRRWALALAPLALLVSADRAAAQQLRGPPLALRSSTFTIVPPPGPGSQVFGPAIGAQFNFTAGNQVGARYTAQLMPGKGSIPLLNNGTMQVSQNFPLPGTPNTTPFEYIAGLPIGDRMGKNAIFYDPDLDTSIGFTPNAPFVPGYPGPITPYANQAINGQAFARNRARAAMLYSSIMASRPPYPVFPSLMPAPYFPMPMGLGAGLPPLGTTNPTGFGYGSANVAFAGFSDPTTTTQDDKKDDKKDKKDDKVDFGKGFDDKAN